MSLDFQDPTGIPGQQYMSHKICHRGGILVRTRPRQLQGRDKLTSTVSRNVDASEGPGDKAQRHPPSRVICSDLRKMCTIFPAVPERTGLKCVGHVCAQSQGSTKQRQNGDRDTRKSSRFTWPEETPPEPTHTNSTFPRKISAHVSGSGRTFES